MGIIAQSVHILKHPVVNVERHSFIKQENINVDLLDKNYTLNSEARMEYELCITAKPKVCGEKT